MRNVIVTVYAEWARVGLDLELPADMAVQELTPLLLHALEREPPVQRPPSDCQWEAHPPGRVLEETETLSNAGVWAGSWIVLRPFQQDR